MKGLVERDMIAMGKNRLFLIVMLALCVFYTVSDMYIMGVLLIPMLFSTVCGAMVRNDLSAPVRRTLFAMPFSAGEYIAEKYLIATVPACLLAVVLQALSAVVHRQSFAQSVVVVVFAVLFTALSASIEIPVNIIFRDRAQLARICVLAVVMAIVALAIFVGVGADGVPTAIAAMPLWVWYGGAIACTVAVLAASVAVSLHALRVAQL